MDSVFFSVGIDTAEESDGKNLLNFTTIITRTAVWAIKVQRTALQLSGLAELEALYTILGHYKEKSKERFKQKKKKTDKQAKWNKGKNTANRTRNYIKK